MSVFSPDDFKEREIPEDAWIIPTLVDPLSMETKAKRKEKTQMKRLFISTSRRNR